MAKPVVPPGQKKKIERDVRPHPRIIEGYGEKATRDAINAHRRLIRSLIATVEAQQTALEQVHARLTALEAGGP